MNLNSNMATITNSEVAKLNNMPVSVPNANRNRTTITKVNTGRKDLSDEQTQYFVDMAVNYDQPLPDGRVYYYVLQIILDFTEFNPSIEAKSSIKKFETCPVIPT